MLGKRKHQDDIDNRPLKKMKMVNSNLKTFIDEGMNKEILKIENDDGLKSSLSINRVNNVWVNDVKNGKKMKVFDWCSNLRGKYREINENELKKNQKSYNSSVPEWMKFYKKTKMKLGRVFNYDGTRIECMKKYNNVKGLFIRKFRNSYMTIEFDVLIGERGKKYELKFSEIIKDVGSLHKLQTYGMVITWGEFPISVTNYNAKNMVMKFIVGMKDDKTREAWMEMNYFEIFKDTVMNINKKMTIFKTTIDTVKKYFKIILNVHAVTGTPLKYLWNTSNMQNKAFEFYKFKKMKDNMIIPPHIPINTKFKIERFTIKPTMQKVIGVDFIELDLKSAFPSAFLEMFHHTKVKGLKLHCRCIKKFLKLKNKYDKVDKDLRYCYKLLLNSGSYGTFNYKGVFPMHPTMIKKINIKTKKVMEEYHKVINKYGNIILAVVDGFLILYNKDDFEKLKNSINEQNNNYKYMKMEINEKFNYALFLDMNTYFLKSSYNNITKIKGTEFVSCTRPKILKDLSYFITEKVFENNEIKASDVWKEFTKKFMNGEVYANWIELKKTKRGKRISFKILNPNVLNSMYALQRYINQLIRRFKSFFN